MTNPNKPGSQSADKWQKIAEEAEKQAPAEESAGRRTPKVILRENWNSPPASSWKTSSTYWNVRLMKPNSRRPARRRNWKMSADGRNGMSATPTNTVWNSSSTPYYRWSTDWFAAWKAAITLTRRCRRSMPACN